MAEAEGLQAHKNAISVRLENLAAKDTKPRQKTRKVILKVINFIFYLCALCVFAAKILSFNLENLVRENIKNLDAVFFGAQRI
jgi:hypothetical protein